MAKGYAETAAAARKIIDDARKGVFAPVYLLMGDESYYPQLVCNELTRYAIDDSERDFNQIIRYGTDTDADTVASDARRYPMMAERMLVVLREAQNMRTLENLSVYCSEPMESTVLVILMSGAAADKRKALYKNVSKNGIVLDSPLVRDYEIDRWIMDYFREKGLEIAPEAASLMGEYSGTDLSRIVSETEKILKNVAGGGKVTVSDVEKYVGITREYSVFELTKALSYKNGAQALKIAAHIGESPRFALPMAISALYLHFYRILKYGALLAKTPRPSSEEKAEVLAVNPYFYQEYDAAVKNYPVKKCLRIISLLEQYDYMGKGGNAGEAAPGDLLRELTAKILI